MSERSLILAFRRRIDDEVATLDRAILNGTLDPGAYRFKCGKREGLIKAREVVTEALKTDEGEDGGDD